VRDRYVLQVLLATLGCGLLMALIAVVDPALDKARQSNVTAPSDASAWIIKPLQVPSQSTSVTPLELLRQAKPAPAPQHVRAHDHTGAIFCAATRKSEARSWRCPYEHIARDACSESGSATPAHAKC
jgi:hypothetical protein